MTPEKKKRIAEILGCYKRTDSMCGVIIDLMGDEFTFWPDRQWGSIGLMIEKLHGDGWNVWSDSSRTEVDNFENSKQFAIDKPINKGGLAECFLHVYGGK